MFFGTLDISKIWPKTFLQVMAIDKSAIMNLNFGANHEGVELKTIGDLSVLFAMYFCTC